MAANGRRIADDVLNILGPIKTQIESFQHMVDYAPGVNNWSMASAMTMRELLATARKTIVEMKATLSGEIQSLEMRGIMLSGPVYEDTQKLEL